ncbi:MAG TPA: ArsA-related P-loop ATPase [Pseudobdellovibrionaceae bacterium]|mgnify:CR=1 FL=1|nr:ArsA-related P-loop ATPase [Pseudobdellovibrionaceae bacterium]
MWHLELLERPQGWGERLEAHQFGEIFLAKSSGNSEQFAPSSTSFAGRAAEFLGSHQPKDFLDRPYVLVSGKGGVGKSFVAAALAALQSDLGRSPLLVETGDRSYFQELMGLTEVHQQAQPTPLGFDLVCWSGEGCLREYVLHLLKLEKIYRMFFENRVMRALVNVAPGLNEIAILGKLTSGLRRVGPRMAHQRMIVDLPATGHALAMLRAPLGLLEAVQVGPMASNSRDVHALLCEPRATAMIVVTLLEELPVTETLEFVAALKREFAMPIFIVVNRTQAAPAPQAELQKLLVAELTMEMPVKPSAQDATANAIQSDVREFIRGLIARDQSEAQARQALHEGLRQLGMSPETCIAEIPRYWAESPLDMIRSAKEELRKSLMTSS